MNYNVLPTRRFERELKRLAQKYPSLKGEYEKLVNELENNPQAGVLLTNNCYKVRLAIASKGKGKSGGARVIIYVHLLNETVFLLTIYDKSETASIKNKEIIEMVRALTLELPGEGKA
jgi:mRNA-degrading endonuclease RelE of RelBE toxin-antitoxin system